ncbi:MAG: M20/M25/M40 family metallo-hydrolase [Acidobacteriota bacterium]
MDPTSASFEQDLCDYVKRRSHRLVNIIQDLVRIPSENRPPLGYEEACQRYVFDFLCRQGWSPELYSLASVGGLREHPLYWPGRNYTGRPNVGARKKGRGGGRSLVLSGHVDTVPRGTQDWRRDPFGGSVEENRLYGRGSNDMKGGVGIHLFAVEVLHELQIDLEGDLVVETVVDEEFGGVNGTIAGRIKGYNGDAAIISEPSFLRICPAQRGGRTAQLTLRASGGVLTEGKFPTGILEPLRYFLARLEDFAEKRKRQALIHDLYSHHTDPVPVSITKVFTGPWGTGEPITIPEACRIEMYWQLTPGEKQVDVEREFLEWLDSLTESAPQLFPTRPEVEFPIRWLPGSAISRSEPLVIELAAAAESALGRTVPVVGFEAPCDMYVFHQAGVPAVLWGPTGSNTHAADEFLEIDSAIAAAKALLVFICRWCGVFPPQPRSTGL